MANEILEAKICQLIAMCYALDVNVVLMAFQKTNSFDTILDKIQRGEIK